MQSEFEYSRPVVSLNEEEFGNLLNKVLSPSHPLQSPEHLKGRDKQLKNIRQCFYAGGRHIFIHGYRGVGKTSLAQTAAIQMQSSDASPIFISCSEGITFSDIIRDIMDEAINENPTIINKIQNSKIAIKQFGITAEVGEAITNGSIPSPQTINEAARLMAFLSQVHSGEPVILLDEFDRLEDKVEQKKFADFIKIISDKKIAVRFIFCGIGETVDELMDAHKSVHRYIHGIKLDRLSFEPRMEIIKTAAKELGIDIDETTIMRICRISDGFPHYIHLLSEKLFWSIYEAGNGGKVSVSLFEEAMQLASDSLEHQLKMPYEEATRKYTNDYEDVLFAVADDHQFERSSSDIYQSYVRIMGSQDKIPLDRPKFNARMNNLKKENYAKILSGTRSGWYTYSEKIMRGYARLRAEQKGVELDVDHPKAGSNFLARDY